MSDLTNISWTIIIKRISSAPIYHTRWQHRALYNNTNHTHTRARAHTRAHTVSDKGVGRAAKNSLEIVIKQVRLEGGFKTGGRIRVVECLRQIVPDRWASIKKKDLSPNVFVFTRGVTKVRVSDADCNCLAGV